MKPFTDLSQVYLFKIKQFQRFSLDFRQFIKTGTQPPEIEPDFDLPLHVAALNQILVRTRSVDIGALIESLAAQVRSDIQRSTVGDLDDPNLGASSRRIEERSLAKHIQETLLYRVFCFAHLLQDAKGNTVNQIGIAAEECVQRALVAGAQEVYEFLVAGLGNLTALQDGLRQLSRRSDLLNFIENRRREEI